MKTDSIYEIICNVLDEMGYIIFDDDDDFNISEYIIDSMQFINFIIKLENKLELELPDDFLVYDMLNSAKGLSNKVFAFISSNKKDVK